MGATLSKDFLLLALNPHRTATAENHYYARIIYETARNARAAIIKKLRDAMRVRSDPDPPITRAHHTRQRREHAC